MNTLIVKIVSCLVILGLGLSVSAQNWVGAGGGGDGVSWASANNWSPAVVPGAGSNVTINSGNVLIDQSASVNSLTIAVGATLRVASTGATPTTQVPVNPASTTAIALQVATNLTLAGSLSIGGLNHLANASLTVGGELTLSGTAQLAVYAGKDTATTWQEFKAGGAQVTIGGKTTLGGTSAIHVFSQRKSGLPVIFDLQDLDIAAGASINGTSRGYGYVGTSYYGPGYKNGYGGSHGGLGGGGAAAAAVYGYAKAPWRPGSPGSFANTTAGGGSALRIKARDIALTGKMLARGGDYAGNCGSGGSIWITCATLTPSGTAAALDARGGQWTDYSYNCGGGGRIAVLVDSPTETQIDALYSAGTCEDLIVVTTDMSSPITSPYPTLASVLGGHGQNWSIDPTLARHGKDGTAVWMINKGDGLQLSVWGNIVPVATDPPYGVSKEAAGDFTFAAPLYHSVPGSGGLSRYVCTGYSWSNSLSQTGSGTTNAFDLSLADDTWVNWKYETTQHFVSLRTTGIGQDNLAVWTNAGVTVAFTAPEVAGYTFAGWEGDVPDANRPDTSISLTVSHPLLITAVYRSADAPAAVSWTGAGDGISWHNGANWSSSAEPYANDAVTIPASATVQVDYHAVARSLTLGSGSLLRIASTGSVVHATELRSQLPPYPTSKLAVGLRVLGDLTLTGASLSVGGLDNASDSVRLIVDSNLTLTGAAKLAVQARYGDAATWQAFKAGGATVEVGGATTLADTAVIYPTCHRKRGLGVIFNLQDLAIASGASINATARGWGWVPTTYYGLGAPTANGGGSYGGKGGGTSAAPYGYAKAPWYPGSPGRITTEILGGGGAIRIQARNISLTGKLLANGGNHGGSGNGCGSGGGIWVTCSNFVPVGAAAQVSAAGGIYTSYSSPNGGGGRIAIMVNSPTATQIDALYGTGTCDNLIVVTTNMSDALTSPYPTLANVLGGHGQNWISNPTATWHGKDGTAVWLQNRGINRQIVVTGTPQQLGVATPGYGIGTLPMGTNTLSVTSPVFVPGTDDRSRIYCQSYVWSNATGSVSGPGSSVAINITDDTWLTWLWGGTEHRLDVRSGGNGAVTENFSQWYAAGATCTLTAVPDPSCTFLYWVGDVPYANRFDAELTLTMDRPRAVIACFTTGSGAARNLAWGGSIDNDWYNPANWDGSAIPGVYDTVSITNGSSQVGYPYEVTLASLTLSGTGKLFFGGSESSAWDCVPVDLTEARPYKLTISGNLILANSAQLAMGGLNATSRVELAVGGDLAMSNTAQLALYAAFAGPASELATYQNGGGKMTVGGLTMLTNTTWILPFCHMHSGAPVIFDLQDVQIAAGCGFDADWKGFGREARYSPALSWHYHGPGAGTTGIGSGWGGSYGGRGGGSNSVISCGYEYAPYLPGSAGRSAQENAIRWGGGGAIRINARNVQLQGILKASGYGAYQYGGGSGGGIWVTCTRFAIGPSALLQAVGGNASDYHEFGGGGGGRIAIGIKLSAAQLASLYATGTMRGLQAQDLADLPEFTAKVNVNGGPGQHNVPGDDLRYDGHPGTAIYVLGPPPGTLIIFR